MKTVDRVSENLIGQCVDINEIQFGYIQGCGTTDVIFILRQLPVNAWPKKKDQYFSLTDSEKAFDRVLLFYMTGFKETKYRKVIDQVCQVNV